MSEKDQYSETVSTSQEESMAKAIEIMLAEIEKKQSARGKVVRPKITFLNGILQFIVLIIYISTLTALFVFSEIISGVLNIPLWLYIIITISVYALIAVFCIKPFLLWLILLYQKFAPEKLRKQCCFFPCCSDYMKLSIQKYGLFNGLQKGMDRISRCHFPNGGEDYP